MGCDAGDSGRTDDLVVGPFRVIYAMGEHDRTDEYRLRYDVFVEEYQFLSGGQCSDGCERDEFDDASCSLVLREVATNRVAACQRLILPELLPAGTLTNLEREYRPLDGRAPIDFARMPRNAWAEVSRTTVAPNYRWGASATSLPAIVAMKYASIALAVAFGRTALFSLSDLRAARLVRHLGFAMVQIGAPVEFHGRRAAFRMDVDAMIRSVPGSDRRVLERLVRAAWVFAGARRGPNSGPARVA